MHVHTLTFPRFFHEPLPTGCGPGYMMSLQNKNEFHYFLILVLNSVMMIFMQELYTLDVSGHQSQALHYVPEIVFAINGFSSYAARLIFCMFTCYVLVTFVIYIANCELVYISKVYVATNKNQVEGPEQTGLLLNH